MLKRSRIVNWLFPLRTAFHTSARVELLQHEDGIHPTMPLPSSLAHQKREISKRNGLRHGAGQNALSPPAAPQASGSSATSFAHSLRLPCALGTTGSRWQYPSSSSSWGEGGEGGVPGDAAWASMTPPAFTGKVLPKHVKRHVSGVGRPRGTILGACYFAK